MCDPLYAEYRYDSYEQTVNCAIEMSWKWKCVVLDTSKVGGTKTFKVIVESHETYTSKPVYLNEFSDLKRWKMVVWLGLGRVELVTFRLLLFRHILE